MKKSNCLAMILAGGKGSRLGVLTKDQAKPGLLFGGKYRIIEGCDYLGVVTALDGKKGIGFVRTTKDTAGETIEVLQSLPIPVRILSRQEALAQAEQK